MSALRQKRPIRNDIGEIMAHFLITSLEPPVIKAVREILLAAKVKSRSGELIVLKTYQSNRSIAIRRIDRARHRWRTSMRADVQRKTAVRSVDRANAWRHTKALNPVMDLPTISVVNSLGPL